MTVSNPPDNKNLSTSELLGHKTKRMTLEVPKEFHTRIKKAAATEDRTIRDIMVEAAVAWLKEKGHH